MTREPEYVKISYNGNDNEIPIRQNFEQFVEEFKNKFNIIDNEIIKITFKIILINNGEKMDMNLENEDDYKTIFTSEFNFKSQSKEIIGIPIIDKLNINNKIDSNKIYDISLNDIKFLNEENNENIIKKAQSEIQKNIPIKYVVKILRNKIRFPDNFFVFCGHDDSDIYFSCVKIDEKSSKVKIYELDDSLKYEITIDIKFKYNKIEPGEKKLNLILSSDVQIFSKNIGTIILLVE